MDVQGNYAYLADTDWLDVVDVSIPARPVRVGRYDSSAAYDVAVTTNYAYVADYYMGLVVLNVSNPASPMRVGSYITAGDPNGVAVKQNRACVADGYAGLQIIDVSNPANPIRLGGYDTPGYAKRVTVSGNYAFVADGDYGLQLIDVSNPAVPVRVANYDQSQEYVNDVLVRGNLAYLAGDPSTANYRLGLVILDISNPTNPVRMGGCGTPGSASSLVASGEYAFVADGAWGLSVVRLAEALQARMVDARMTGGIFRFDVLGTTNLNYIVQSTTNLTSTNWLNLMTNSAPFSVTNPASPGEPNKFFRALYRP